MAIQQRNSEMVNLLKADFIHKQDTVYLAGIVAGSILMLPGLVAFWSMSVSLDDDNTLYADAAIVTGNLQAGSLGAAWDGLAFGSGWYNYGYGWQTGQVKKVGDIVFVRGLVSRFTGVGTLIATLPVGSRPPALTMLHCMSDDAICRVDIGGDGEITYVIGGSPALWIWLNHWFSVDP